MKINYASKCLVLLAIGIYTFGTNVSAQTTFKFNFPKGSKVVYESKSKMKISVNESDENGENNSSNEMSFESLGDSAGITLMNYKLLRSKLTTTGGMLPIVVNTDDMNADTTGLQGKMLVMYRKLINYNFQLGINSKGELIQEKGLKEWITENKSVLDNLSEGGKTGAQSMDENTFKQSYSSLFGLFPEKPIKLGGKWKKSFSTTSNGIKINFDNVYILDSVNENKAVIKTQTQIYAYSPIESVPDAWINIAGDGKGVIWLDMKTGMVIKQTSDSKMEMKPQMKGGQSAGMEMPVTTIENVSSINLKP